MAYKKPERKFKKSPQGLDEAKSKGQVQRSKNNNLVCSARTLFDNAEILPQLIDNIKAEVEQGINKNAIDLLKVIKEPDTQDLHLSGGLSVQKVFVDGETKQQTDEHIDKYIDE